MQNGVGYLKIFKFFFAPLVRVHLQIMVMKKRFLYLLFFVQIFAFAQNLKTIPGLWWMQLPLINPAASAANSELNAAVGTHLYPNGNLFTYGNEAFGSIDVLLDKMHSGVGFSYFSNNINQILNPKESFFMYQRFGLNYNYQINLPNSASLAVGTRVELVRQSWNYLNWLTPSGEIDPSLMPANGHGSDVNIGFGLHYQSELLMAGASIMPAANVFDGANFITPSSDLQFYGGYFPRISEEFVLETHALVSFYGINADASALASIAAQLRYNDLLYAGLGFNFEQDAFNTIQVLLGVNISRKMRLQYTYLFDLSEITFGNTHAICLQYRIAKS